jgi:hypothetical protein
MFSVTGALYVAILAVFLFVKSFNGQLVGAKVDRYVWIPSCAAFGMYSLVHVEPRFVGGFGLMLLVTLMARVKLPETQTLKGSVRFMVAVALAPVIAVAYSVGANVKDLNASGHNEHLAVSQGLLAMRIQPAREVAFIGNGKEAYWAHLAGVRIIAELPEQGEPGFLASDSERQAQALEKFVESGASIAVMKVPTKVSSPLGWKQIAGTPYYVHWLNRAKLRVD